MNFDFDSLTLGEVAAVEELSGQGIGQIAEADAPKGKALAAIVMVVKRRQGNPTFSFNEALTVPLSEANVLLSGDEDDDAGKDESSARHVTE